MGDKPTLEAEVADVVRKENRLRQNDTISADIGSHLDGPAIDITKNSSSVRNTGEFGRAALRAGFVPTAFLYDAGVDGDRTRVFLQDVDDIEHLEWAGEREDDTEQARSEGFISGVLFACSAMATIGVDGEGHVDEWADFFDGVHG